jgi:membrane-bound PQQ-dependent dehydrogenase (glucose/quinate/shikimate family)
MTGRAAIGILTVILAAVGLTLLAGGVLLLAEGGSIYYLAAGLMVLACAGALWRGSRMAFAIYGALLAGTLAWSLWEVGLDGWALAPRLLGPAVLGLLLLALPLGRLSGITGRKWTAVPVLAILAAVGLAGGLALREEGAATRAVPAGAALAPGDGEWRHWGQSVAGTRHAAARQIDTANVGTLELAWRFDSDVPPQGYVSFEATPLAADGRLYLCLQPGIVVALDQDSGRQVWRYTMPDYGKVDFTPVFGGKCRGVSWYEAPGPVPDCPKRVLFSTPDGWLRAVDAATGKPCASFGGGRGADLHAGLEAMLPADRMKVMAMPSSPPAIINGVAVVGQTVSDLESLAAPSGVIRGYDAVTGALKWAWDAGRPDRPLQPGEPYGRATPNAWGAIGGDGALGLAFVPLGNSPPDYFGGMRPPASDRFTTSVVALDVATGALRWSFQTVHHDLWDYDLAAQPVSVDLPGAGGGGAATPALLVPTKLGQIFVLDRRTGQPVDRVVEKPVPQGGVPGERTAPTQPQTTGFPSLAGPDLTEADMWGMTPLDQMWCRIAFRRAEYRGQFTPVTTRDTIMYPGTAGGINWGSVSIDRARGLLVVNALRFANFGRLIPRASAPAGGFGGAEGTAIFEQAGTPWIFAQSTFMSPLGVPCQRPPYGTISAFDLETRKPVWTKSLGTSAKSGPFGIPTLLPIRMGVPNMGGSITTAGGLTFIAAAQDRLLRAFDTASGRELWSAPLPAVGAATPMSYVSPKGRQFVVIAAGGHYGIPGPPAGAVMAFALPQR